MDNDNNQADDIDIDVDVDVAQGSEHDGVDEPDLDDLDLEVDYDVLWNDRHAHRHSRAMPNRRPKRNLADVYRGLAGPDEVPDTGIEFTYSGSRHERAWIMEALDPYVIQGTITDVLRLAKGGKEATVYVCAAGPALGVEHLAAKIYRPRKFRSLRNDALYRAGRRALNADGYLIKDSRAVHAMQKGTGFGKALAHTSWLAHEYTAIQRLHAAGADVPQPFAMGNNVILMQYIGDADMPAYTLNHVALDAGEARPLFDRVIHNVDLMLAARCVHGDLSAYNILYWEGDITLIDFPQVVNPFENPAGREIFDRDVARVCDYFANYGVDADAAALAAELWARHVPAELWEPVPLVEEEIDDAGWAGRR